MNNRQSPGRLSDGCPFACEKASRLLEDNIRLITAWRKIPNRVLAKKLAEAILATANSSSQKDTA